MRRVAIIGAALLLSCDWPQPTPREQPGPSQEGAPNGGDSTVTLSVPETGIALGWGWDTYNATPVRSICITYKRGEDLGQTMQTAVHEVSDTYEAMKRMGFSAEASVKSIGFKATGKTAFAKSARVSNYYSSFVIQAQVENGVVYAAPAPRTWTHARRNSESVGPDGAAEGAVLLTDEALSLAKRGSLDRFVQMCGDSFVSAVYSGAELTALVTIKTTSSAQKRKVSAAASGSGWGVSASTLLSEEEEESADRAEKEVSFFQTGGRGLKVPSGRKGEILERLNGLAAAAAEDPKDFRMAVTPYETLGNWPQEAIPRSRESDEFAQLAAYWGDYKTIYDEIEMALESPGEFVGVVAVDDHFDLLDYTCQTERPSEADRGLSPCQIDSLEVIQDEVLDNLKKLERQARRCVFRRDACEFQEEKYRSPYAYRTQLPLPKGFIAETDPRDALDYLEKKIKDARGLPLFRRLLVELANKKALAAQEAALVANLRKYAEHLRREIIKANIEEPAKSRCRIGPNTVGCIPNCRIREWGKKVGMRWSADAAEVGADDSCVIDEK